MTDDISQSKTPPTKTAKSKTSKPKPEAVDNTALAHPTLLKAITKKGYEKLTPVQSAVIAPELDGRDLLVSAQTGSGKTVAFGLARPDLRDEFSGYLRELMSMQQAAQ